MQHLFLNNEAYPDTSFVILKSQSGLSMTLHEEDKPFIVILVLYYICQYRFDFQEYTYYRECNVGIFDP